MAAVAAAGTENVAGETFAVNAGENIVLARDVAAGEREMGGVVDQGAEKMQFEMSVLVREIDGFFADDELFRFAAVRDDVRDGDELETPFLFEFDEGIKACHLSVVVHDFADHARGFESGEPREIDGRFGVTRSLEHAAGACRDGEGVTGMCKIGSLAFRINKIMRRFRAVECGDSGCGSDFGIDAFSESRVEHVGGRRTCDAEFVCTGFCDGRADETARMRRHENNVFRRDFFRRADEIAFIFAVFVISDDNHFAVADVFDCGFDGIERSVHFLRLSF